MYSTRPLHEQAASADYLHIRASKSLESDIVREFMNDLVSNVGIFFLKSLVNMLKMSK